jgi:hypothetical protein
MGKLSDIAPVSLRVVTKKEETALFSGSSPFFEKLFSNYLWDKDILNSNASHANLLRVNSSQFV